ncbi:helix-turn-helix domain-containing protein [Patescibacteria group bacterium]|nr:helix-turn-helix domain-containing protein [Patescibacteria group bacterium]
MKNKKRITARERDLIALFKAEGLSSKECARRLNRHPSVIGRELKKFAKLYKKKITYFVK